MADSEEGIVVLGSLRSGTTLLRRLLDAHPNIACPAETCLLSACARFLHADQVADGLEFGVLTGLGFAGFEADEVLERLREFAFGFHREHAKKQGKARWAEKTATDSFYIDEIEQLCGDQARFICMTRHGLDVACSIDDLSTRGMTYLSEVHDYVKQHPRPLEAFAHAWVDVNTRLRAFADRHPDTAITLRYEDSVEDPEAEMARVLKFLGEDMPADLIDNALAKKEGAGLGDWKTYGRKKIGAQSTERWKSLPPPVTGALATICNPTLQLWGYPPVDVPAAVSAAEARRRYEFALMLQAAKAEDSGD